MAFGVDSVAGAPELTKSPAHWLLIGLGLGVIGVVARWVSDSLPVSFLGWIVGGFGSIAMLGIFTHQDTQRRSSGWIVTQSWIGPLRAIVLIVAFVAITLNAWDIADTVSRSGW